MPHLTSTTESPRHLASVTYNGGTHLVSIRQKTAWSNRTFVVTPSATRWSAAIATGVQQYPTYVGGDALKNDTEPLITALSDRLDSCSWRTGYHPVWNYFARGNVKGPYSKRTTLAANSCECGYSFVANRYTLHRLHFSRMSSYTAYLRVYVPSKLLQKDLTTNNIYLCSCEDVAFWYNTSKLSMMLYTSLPSMSSTVARGGDYWELNGVSNNGASGNANLSYHSVAYNPWHGDDIGALPVYTPNNRGSSWSSTSPTMYYHDFPISGSSNLDVLATNPANVWAAIGFEIGNGFTSPTSGAGLGVNASACCWIYRADLVLKCTSGAFV